jgi:hypothetical protein
VHRLGLDIPRTTLTLPLLAAVATACPVGEQGTSVNAAIVVIDV